MCRWLAYAGPPVYLDTLILKPQQSLITQSRDAQKGVTSLNAAGYGVGWYGDKPEPGVYKDILPAWNDDNLKSLATHVKAPLFFGHVRASTGTSVSKVNCHPFTHGKWLFMHNGMIGDFERVRRNLTMAIAPDLFPCLQGATDSEVLFYLLLTHGLDNDPKAAFARTIGLVLDEMAKAGTADEHMAVTAAATDGKAIYAVRFANDARPASLFYALGARPLTAAGVPAMEAESGCLVVSEPLDDVRAVWQRVPPAHMLIAADGGIGAVAFEPVRG